MNAPVENFAVPHFGDIPLACCIPSKTNPRKHFDEDALNELAASIKKVGVAQPILCRPLPTTETMIDCVEIVAGERRYRASKIAGMQTIPAIVRILSDVEVLEIQLIENLQRADVHPIEEAEGYERLMKEHKYTADQLAEKVGKSKAYIYGRLKLCALVPEAREAFFAGKINASIAERIARMPVPALQAKATQEIVHNYGQPEPMSFRRAVEYLQARYMLDLGAAKFAIKDAKLVPAAGSCMSCPKRTGNQPEIYQDVDADVCTDPDCFKSKCDAHNERKLSVATKSGLPIYEAGSDAYEQMRNNNQVAGYTSLSQLDRLANDKDSHRQIDTALKPEQLPKPVAYIKGKDDVTPVFDKTAIQLALEKAGLAHTLEKHNAMIAEKLSGEGRFPKEEVSKAKAEAERKALELQAEQETKYRIALYDALRPHMLKDESRLHVLREAAKLIAEEWGFPSAIKGNYPFNPIDTNEAIKFIDEASEAEVALYILELALCETFSVSTWQMRENAHTEHIGYQSLLALAGKFGVEQLAIRAQVNPQDETKPEEPETEEKKVQPKTAKSAAGGSKKVKAAKDTADTEKAAPAKPTPAKKAKVAAKEESTKADTPPAAAAWPFPTGARK